MKLVVFQGNPGAKYQGTRHNIGFLVADNLAQKHKLKWQPSAKFHAELAELGSAWLVKPQTFYNETGRIVRRLTDFYKIDPSVDLLAVCDDLNLQFGVLKTRRFGSDGGNNGLKSIISEVGSNFARLRLGTGNDISTPADYTKFVLSPFSRVENAKLPQIVERAAEEIENFLADNFENHKIVV